MKTKNKENTSRYSQKEIGVLINNAVQAAQNPVGGEISDIRLRKLREYASAVIEPLLEHLREQTYEEEPGRVYPSPLKADELRLILLTAALYVQLKEIVGTDRLPMERVSKELFKQDI